MRSLKVFLLITIVLVLYSCGGGRYHKPTGTAIMTASWYGSEFHGRPTASGEIFNMYDYTAAHKTLPFGTRLKITNPANGRSVIVRINDRGPFVRGRDIDLSYGAAKKIGLLRQGVGRVYVEFLGRDPGYIKHVRLNATEGPFTIQVASFKEPANAYRLKRILQDRYNSVYIFRVWIDGNRFYRVRIGKFSYLEQAKEIAERLAEEGYDVIVLRYEGIL